MRATAIRWLDRALVCLGFLFALYHLVMVFGRFQQSLEHYSNHFTGALFISGLAALARTLKRAPVRGPQRLVPGAIVLALVCATFGALYIRFDLERLETLQTFLAPRDMIVGALLLVGILGITWAEWGAAVTAVVTVGVLYFFLGQHLPGLFGHQGFDATFVMSYLGMGLTSGVFKWVPLSADTVFLFMVFGALLSSTGIETWFIAVGRLLGNVLRGGVAYSAVVSGALIGMVSGNSIGNAVLVGNMTIPQMRRAGYTAAASSAIVATAASGGQIMPPVMGLGVFLLAAFLNIPYIEAAFRATIPALLFYVGVGAGVLALTWRSNISSERLPVDRQHLWRHLPTFLVPFTILIVILLRHYSPNYAGFCAIVATVVMSQLQGRQRAKLGEIARGLAEGGITGAQLGALIVAAGTLAQTVEITNFGDVAYRLLSATVAGSGTFVALLIAMLFVILLGTGLPTAIAYVIGAVTLAPTLQNMGLDRFAIHFFIFYYAVFANNTPPVALNVSAAAKVSGAPFWSACKETMLLSAVGLWIPFVFVYNPTILTFPRVPMAAMLPIVAIIASMLTLSIATYGYLGARPIRRSSRVASLLAALLALVGAARGELAWLAAFLAVVVAVLLWERPRRRVVHAAQAAASPGPPLSEGPARDTERV